MGLQARRRRLTAARRAGPVHPPVGTRRQPEAARRRGHRRRRVRPARPHPRRQPRTRHRGRRADGRHPPGRQPGRYPHGPVPRPGARTVPPGPRRTHRLGVIDPGPSVPLAAGARASVNDLIINRRNDHKSGLANGDVVRIEEITSDGEVLIRKATGRDPVTGEPVFTRKRSPAGHCGNSTPPTPGPRTPPRAARAQSASPWRPATRTGSGSTPL